LRLRGSWGFVRVTIAVLKKSYVRARLDPSVAARLAELPPKLEKAVIPDYSTFKSMFWRNPSILLSTFGINLLSLALPLVMLQVYQRILPNAALDTFAYLMGGMAFVILLDGLLRAARSYAIAWQGSRFEHIMACQSVRSLTGASLQAFERAPVGRHLEHLQSIETLRDFYGGTGLINLLETPFVVLFLVTIFLIGGPLGFVPLGLFICCGAIAYLIGEKLKTQIETRNKVDMQRFNFILEVLNGLQHVKSQALEAFMQRRYERLQSTAAIENCELARLSAMSHACGAFFSYFVLFGTAAVGAYMVIDGALSQGALAACSLLAGRATQPFLRSMAFWSEYQSVSIAQENLETVLAYQSESVGDTEQTVKIDGRVTFENIDKAYGEKTVFKDLSFSVEAGETVLIDGYFGSGKSTLLRLVAGLVEPDSGAVRLDGVDLKELDPTLVRRQVTYMPENAVLFRGTILENLTLFEPERYLDRAMELATALKLDRAIAKLPDGFDTEVGDDLADLLPLGIRQQIGIVRALARRPRIVLFDQPNGGLDLESDQRLVDLIDSLKGESTMIMVTPRRAYRRMADRVIMIDQDPNAAAAPFPDAARQKIIASSGKLKVVAGRKKAAAPAAAQPRSLRKATA